MYSMFYLACLTIYTLTVSVIFVDDLVILRTVKK